MRHEPLDRDALFALERKYREEKRIGWTEKGSRAKDNQTIAINRTEILRLVDKACFAEHLFQECYYLEQLLGAISNRAPSIALPKPIEEFRKCWTGEQLTACMDAEMDEAMLEAVRASFPQPEEIGEIEQAILFMLRLVAEKHYKDTILVELFRQLPKCKPKQDGEWSWGNCLRDVGIPPIDAPLGIRAYCPFCGQRLI